MDFRKCFSHRLLTLTLGFSLSLQTRNRSAKTEFRLMQFCLEKTLLPHNNFQNTLGRFSIYTGRSKAEKRVAAAATSNDLNAQGLYS